MSYVKILFHEGLELGLELVVVRTSTQYLVCGGTQCQMLREECKNSDIFPVFFFSLEYHGLQGLHEP